MGGLKFTTSPKKLFSNAMDVKFSLHLKNMEARYIILSNMKFQQLNIELLIFINPLVPWGSNLGSNLISWFNRS